MNPSGCPRVKLLGSLCCVVEHLQHIHSYDLMAPFNLPSVLVPLYEWGSPVDLRSVCLKQAAVCSHSACYSWSFCPSRFCVTDQESTDTSLANGGVCQAALHFCVSELHLLISGKLVDLTLALATSSHLSGFVTSCCFCHKFMLFDLWVRTLVWNKHRAIRPSCVQSGCEHSSSASISCVSIYLLQLFGLLFLSLKEMLLI